MNESILSALASAKEKVGELLRERDKQVLTTGSLNRQSYLSDLMSEMGTFVSSHLDDVWDARDKAEDEINELRAELEGKNYELEMVKMELEASIRA